MKDKNIHSKRTSQIEDINEENDSQGYPIYPSNQDIYNNYKEEHNIDPEDISKIKDRNDKYGKHNEKDFDDYISGIDLDVPGSELDDEQEDIGSEDEENNYYSLTISRKI